MSPSSSGGGTFPVIHVDIGTMELRGFSRADQDGILRAFHAEFYALIAGQGRAWGQDVSRLHAADDRALRETTALGGGAASIGSSIARAVFHSLSRRPSSSERSSGGER
jgi:hypothetical protein